jgi:hypothetical protein
MAKRQKSPAADRSSPRAVRKPGVLRVFPHELRPGDRVLDDEPHEWEVVALPAAYRKGKILAVRMQKPGDPSVMRDERWPAHAPIAVRRG